MILFFYVGAGAMLLTPIFLCDVLTEYQNFGMMTIGSIFQKSYGCRSTVGKILRKGGLSMLKKIIVLGTVFCLLVGAAVYAAASGVIDAVISDCLIEWHGFILNDKLQHPVLSYDGHTYIAVRDMAEIFDKDIHWNGKDKIIFLLDKTSENPAIQNEETAVAISRAMMHQFFPDEVSDQTTYEVGVAHVDFVGSKPFFHVDVQFDGNAANGFADAVVDIDPDTGEIMNIYRFTEEQTVFVYP